MGKPKFELKKVREKKHAAKKRRKKQRRKSGPKPKKVGKRGRELAARLAKKGATNDQIAAGLDVSERTYYRLMQFDPDLKNKIKEAKAEADDAVEVALYARAIGFEFSEEQLSFGVPVAVQKVALPDAKAAGIWLYNRRRDDWKQRQVFEDGAGNAIAPVFVVPAFNNSVNANDK